eukprot:12126053-Alexandrium_andersonii.AAC.1
MSASLVGSEMCIRDSSSSLPPPLRRCPGCTQGVGQWGCGFGQLGSWTAGLGGGTMPRAVGRD